jgi:hypothetical protein
MSYSEPSAVTEHMSYAEPYAVTIVTGAPSPPAPYTPPEYHPPRRCCDENAGAMTCVGIAAIISLVVCICCILPIVIFVIVWKQSVDTMDTLFNDDDVWGV